MVAMLLRRRRWLSARVIRNAVRGRRRGRWRHFFLERYSRHSSKLLILVG
jgi:hypothetical protein